MKVFYVNSETDTIISLQKLMTLHPKTKVVVNYDGRNIEYTLKEIYNCKDWKVYTEDDDTLNLEDVRELLEKVDKGSNLYKKLQKEENRLLNTWVEDVTGGLQLERSLY